MAKRVAVIDIGSNSARMVIYEKTSRFAFHLLHETKVKVRISEGAYKNGGNLQELPMQRTLLALKDFINIASFFKVRKTLCVATSALRDAPNKKEFLQRVRKELKLNIKIIDGQKEAYFGAIACANLLPKQRDALSIDIGGGSSEFAYIDNYNVSHTISLKLGTVRLKELFFDTNNIKEAIKYIDIELSKLPSLNISTLIGIGGTFRAISNSILKLENHPLNKLHAYQYTTDKLQDFISKILDVKNNNELKKLLIKPNRFDVIKPGALILQRVLNRLNISDVITSGVGVREGVYLADLLRNSKHKFPANFNTSLRYIIDTHIPDKNFSNILSKLTKQIFDEVHQKLDLDIKYKRILTIASKLYHAGSSIHFYSQHKHTYYIIQSALEYGFTHQEIMLISTISRFAKTKIPNETYLKQYETLLPETKTTINLSFILMLSVALLSHRPREIDFNIKLVKNKLQISSKSDLYLAKDAVDKLEFPHKLSLEFLSS